MATKRASYGDLPTRRQPPSAVEQNAGEQDATAPSRIVRAIVTHNRSQKKNRRDERIVAGAREDLVNPESFEAGEADNVEAGTIIAGGDDQRDVRRFVLKGPKTQERRRAQSCLRIE